MRDVTAIAKIVDKLRGDSRMRALFLSGSHAVGLEDAYSDVDFLLVSSDGATDEIAAAWRSAIAATGEIVLWRDRQVRPTLINAVMDDWLRIDVLIVRLEQMADQYRDNLKPLFDHDGIHASLPCRSQPAAPPPSRMKYQFEEFIRILGLLPVAVGREEYINGATGIFHLRSLLIDLFVEQTSAPHRGGALHLNRLITDEQKSVLAGLPVPEPARDPIISANLAYARAYLPRARLLAKEWGIEWPERFEMATWKHLEETLSIWPPYETA